MSKWLITTDWHFGNADNSERHNLNLIDFTSYLIDFSKKNNITRFAHLGDMFHQRDKLNVQTINYASLAINQLAKHFQTKVFVKGNHDLYYRDTRVISSLEPFRNSVHLVDDVEEIGGILFVSWLCNQEEFDQVVKTSHLYRFICGHFEFSGFMMNDHYQMEHGNDSGAFSLAKQIFSGHYHMRQHRSNISYIGNPFPFDMNDANDRERGFMVLDTDSETWEYINYEKIKVISIPYEEFLKDEFEKTVLLDVPPENITIRIEIKNTVSDLILEQVQQKLNHYAFAVQSHIDYRGGKLKEIMEQETDIANITSLDDAVLRHITKMEPVVDVDNDLLASLYRSAMDDPIHE